MKAGIFLRIIVLLFVLYHQQCQLHRQNPEKKNNFSDREQLNMGCFHVQLDSNLNCGLQHCSKMTIIC